MQRYDWIHTFNVRDLGYTPTMNGKYIKPQRFIRSDAPHTIDDAVKEFLIEHNIITIIDLRNTKIANMNPNAFANIISNTLKYSDGDFGVKMDRNGSVIFTNTAHNLNAVTVGRLFDRFYTVEASRNSSGLGLSIAKVLIERMGGTISAQYEGDRLSIIVSFSFG